MDYFQSYKNLQMLPDKIFFKYIKNKPTEWEGQRGKCVWERVTERERERNK